MPTHQWRLEGGIGFKSLRCLCSGCRGKRVWITNPYPEISFYGERGRYIQNRKPAQKGKTGSAPGLYKLGINRGYVCVCGGGGFTATVRPSTVYNIHPGLVVPSTSDPLTKQCKQEPLWPAADVHPISKHSLPTLLVVIRLPWQRSLSLDFQCVYLLGHICRMFFASTYSHHIDLVGKSHIWWISQLQP